MYFSGNFIVTAVHVLWNEGKMSPDWFLSKPCVGFHPSLLWCTLLRSGATNCPRGCNATKTWKRDILSFTQNRYRTHGASSKVKIEKLPRWDLHQLLGRKCKEVTQRFNDCWVSKLLIRQQCKCANRQRSNETDRKFQSKAKFPQPAERKRERERSKEAKLNQSDEQTQRSKSAN